MDNINKGKSMLKQVGKVVGASTAVGAGIGATGALVNRGIKKKKEQNTEKTASEIVNATFNKIAGFDMADLLPDDVLNKMQGIANKGKDALNSVKSNTGNGTNFNGSIKNVKPGSPSLEQIKAMGGKKGLSPKTKTAIGAGIAAASLIGGGALAHNAKKKKQEKTASEIVNEVYSQIAK